MSSKALFACSLAALTGLAAVGVAAEKALKSGLQPGDKTSAFQTRDITGPNKGKSLCYV
ncbi:MAG: hypothetical protein HY721_21910 [Planctomycetes bacterium]|nr:hypothetical protein [Planctomycetota bacterium]